MTSPEIASCRLQNSEAPEVRSAVPNLMKNKLYEW